MNNSAQGLRMHQVLSQLSERVKELSALYFISNLANDDTKDIPTKLQEIVDRIPESWQYPEQTVAQLHLDEMRFQSRIFEPDVSYVHQKQPISIHGEPRGHVMIHYLEGAEAHPSFLEEEYLLLKAIAQEIGGMVSRNEHRKRESEYLEQLLQKDRLKILGELTAGIAHELNTPLGNIIGFTEFAKKQSNKDELQSDLDKVLNSAIYAREVVKKLMFFSCRMPQNKQIVNLYELMHEVRTLLRVRLQEEALEIIIEPEQPTKLELEADSIQITQLLFNLLLNAIHASDKGSVIHLLAFEQAGWVYLKIKDQGYGIPDEFQNRIFEPFFTTKDTGEGTGLGLSVVHGIVQAHGGRIEVSSKPNFGTTFTVKLPVCRKKMDDA